MKFARERRKKNRTYTSDDANGLIRISGR